LRNSAGAVSDINKVSFIALNRAKEYANRNVKGSHDVA
jgi:hypothetical protein